MDNSMWVVGQYRTQTEVGTIWDFQGVFDSRAKAVAACRNADYFIAPATINEPIPDEVGTWPGVEYPLA